MCCTALFQGYSSNGGYDAECRDALAVARATIEAAKKDRLNCRVHLEGFSCHAVVHVESVLCEEGFLVTYPLREEGRSRDLMHVSWDLTRVVAAVKQLTEYTRTLRKMKADYERMLSVGYARKQGEDKRTHDERVRRLPDYSEYVRLRNFHRTQYTPSLFVATDHMNTPEIHMAVKAAEIALAADGEFRIELAPQRICIDWANATRLGF